MREQLQSIAYALRGFIVFEFEESHITPIGDFLLISDVVGTVTLIDPVMPTRSEIVHSHDHQLGT